MWLAVGVCTAIGLGLCYALLVVWSAKHNVEGAPTADMYICDVHGPMPIGATFIVFDSMEYETAQGAKVGQIRACPICFEGQIKKAREQRQ